MDNKKANQTRTRQILISAIIWASVILACSAMLGDNYKKIGILLVCGATAEMLLLNARLSKKSKETNQ